MRQTPGGRGVWDGVAFTTEPVEQCDGLVVLNRPRAAIRTSCPPENVMLFSQEPPFRAYAWQRKAFRHFPRVYTFWSGEGPNVWTNEQTALPWHVGLDYDALKRLDPGTSTKTNRVSWVTSNASTTKGHKLRLAWIEYLRSTGYDFDLFGRGFRPIDDKLEGIRPYKFSLAFESFSCDHYWTEKIADCLLCWTIPIYWGARGILDYFPKEAVVVVTDPDPARNLGRIRDLVESDYWERSLPALAEARTLILDRYQLFPHVAAKLDRSPGPPQPIRIPAFHPPALASRARRIRRRLQHLWSSFGR